jgi:uncharacterized membrane protein
VSEPLAVVAGAGSAALCGFYLAFSAVVMPALDRRPAADAASTMIAVNESAVRAPFMALFFGTAAACAAVAIVAVASPSPESALRLAGAAAQLTGVALTVGANVPLNNRLAAGSLEWAAFARPWTRANHARTVASLLGAVALLA